MKRITTTLPVIGLFGATRAIAGAGTALLLARRLSRRQRTAVGWTLVVAGAISTLPFAVRFLFGSARERGQSRSTSMEGPGAK